MTEKRTATLIIPAAGVCSGLRGHVVPIIAAAVENSVQLQCKFDQFFPRCETFYQRLDVVVFCLVSGQFQHVYVHHGASYVYTAPNCNWTEMISSKLHRN